MEKPLLITIPFSHYCEKARWGLEHALVAYDEEGHAPGFHRPRVRRTGASGTTPALITADGVLGDSTDILRWASGRAPPDCRLYGDNPEEEAEIAALEDRFDRELGPHTRRWGYFQAFAQTQLLMRLFDHRVPRWERLSFRVTLPVIRPLMRRGMKIDPASVERSIAKIQTVFDSVGAHLSDGRPFLVGARLSAADITFASLASLVLGLEELDIAYPRPEDLPAEAAAFVRRQRAHPAGQFARRMYRDHRR